MVAILEMVEKQPKTTIINIGTIMVEII